MLKLAMEPSFIGLAVMEGGPNQIIKLDKSPRVDEVIFLLLYYLASLDYTYLNNLYVMIVYRCIKAVHYLFHFLLCL